MSDFKNALDSYKKSAGKKTENSGFSAGKIPPPDKKNKNTSKTLPEHLKKSLSDPDNMTENSRKASQERPSGRNTDDRNEISVAEKYVRESLPSVEKGEGERFLSALKKIKIKSDSPEMKNSQNNSISEGKVKTGYKKAEFGEFTVSPEKFVFNELRGSNENNGYFIRETENEPPGQLENPGESISSEVLNRNKEYTDSGIKRVAKLIALLGKDEAANVLKSFSPAEIERIASELLKIKQIGHDEASELLKIINKKNTKKEIFTGGVDTAREILVQAYGKEKGEQLLKKALPEKREKPFEFLNDIEALQIKMILKNESSTITAIILSHLHPEKSAALINEYTAEEQKELLLKMSQKGRISSEVVEKIENGLKEKIREQGKIVTKEVDGKNRLAGILRFMDPEEEERILDELTDEDPDLSREIDSKIFSIDIVHDIPDRDFQKILNDFSETEIALILKGRSGKIKKKFAKNLSQQRKELIHRESEYIGIVRKSEVNKATTEFIDYIRQFEKDGKIIINRGGNLFV